MTTAPADPNHINNSIGAITTILFDCDNTLYPASAGIHEAMRERIAAYIRNYVKDIKPEQVEIKMMDYYRQYGLALKGLIVHHQVDPSHYMPLVDGGVDDNLHLYLRPIPELDSMLDRIRPEIQKLVFTNSDISHVRHVLHELVGLPLPSNSTNGGSGDDDGSGCTDGKCCPDSQHQLQNGKTITPHHHASAQLVKSVPKHVHQKIGKFDGVIDITALDFDPKPMRESYEKALQFAHETDPRRVLFVDDSCLNLVAAKAMGFITVLVSKSTPQHNSNNSTAAECADFAIESLLDLPTVLPSLFIPLDNATTDTHL